MSDQLQPLIDAGFSLIPVDPVTKVAQVKEWGIFMDGTRRLDLEQIKPAHGWACICGQASGNLEVIDIDDKHADDKAALRAEVREIMQSVLGELAGQIPVAQTQSGGLHIYLPLEDGVHLNGNLKLARNSNRETVVETRGQGGYVVCPPTKGYQWLRAPKAPLKPLTGPLRDELYSQLRVLNEYEDVKEHRDHVPVAIASQGHRPGDEYNNRHTPIEALEALGWTAISRGDKVYLRRPGKQGGISATWNAIPGRLWVFSTNAAPFEDQKTYSPFEVYALLEHQGDFAKAAKSLAEQGFGEVRGESIPVKIGSPDERDPFPTIPGIVGELALNYEKAYNIPYSAAALVALTCTSACLGKSIQVTGATNHGSSFCNLYTLIPMPPSSGKSTLRHLWAGLVDYNHEKIEEWEESLPEVKSRIHELKATVDSNKQELRKLSKGGGMDNLADIEVCRDAMKRAEAELDEIANRDGSPKEPPMVYFSNATSEGLTDEMNRTADQAIAALDTEAGDAINLMLGMHRQTGTADVDLYLSGWSCESRTMVRRSQRSVLKEPLLTMLLAAQPEKVKSFICHQEVQKRGLLARFIICHDVPELRERPEGGFPALDTALTRRWDELNKALLRNRFDGEPCDIPCTPEAVQIFNDFYNEDVRARGGEWFNFNWLLGKSEEQAIRLSGVLAVLFDHREIYADTATLACKIIRWSLKSTVASLWKTDIQETQDSALEIIELVKAQESGELAFSKAKRALKVQESKLEKTVENCEFLTVVKVKGGKRIRLANPSEENENEPNH